MDRVTRPIGAWRTEEKVIFHVGYAEGESELLMFDCERGCFRPSNLAFDLVDSAEPMPTEDAAALGPLDFGS